MRNSTCIAGGLSILACMFSVALPLFATDYVAIDLGTLNGTSSEACAINDKNQILGTIQFPCSGPVFNPFFWEKGTITPLPLRGVTRHSLNNSGQVVGSANFDDCGFGCFTVHGVLWQNGALTDLGTITPVAINDAG